MARSAAGASRKVMSIYTPTSMALYQHTVPRLRAALGSDSAHRLREEGRAMNIDDAFSYALEGIEGT